MKTNMLIAALMVISGAAAAHAADGRPAAGTLSQMGLSSLQVVSDQQAMDVRGQGFGALHLNITFTDGVTGIALPIGSTTFGTEPAVVPTDGTPINRSGFIGTTLVSPDFTTIVTAPIGAAITNPVTGATVTFQYSGNIFGGGN